MVFGLFQRRGGDNNEAAPERGVVQNIHPSPSNNKKKQVLIVGGGPAGLTTALALAKKHSDKIDVTVCEAYPHPTSIETNAPKAYIIALSGRGYRSLQRATGMDDPLLPETIPGAVASVNLARHPNPKNKAREHKDTPTLIVPRKVLAGHLMDQAIQAGVTVHLQHTLKDVDFVNQVALFDCKQTAKQLECNYDLLIGADGSKSTLRGLMHDDKETLADFQVLRLEEDSMEYQVVTLRGNTFPKLPQDSVHAWNNKAYNSICLGFPLADENMLCAFVLPEGKLQELQDDYNNNKDKKDTATPSLYETALSTIMPDLPDEARHDMMEQLSQGQPASGGTCVWTSSLGCKNVALIGDSGHGMWPSLGQGANCALETAMIFCQVFDERIDNEEEDWATTLVQEYSNRRHFDAKAAVDLTYGGIGARKSRGRGNSPLSYKLQIGIIMLLNKLTLGVVPKPVMLRMLMGEAVPYSEARQWNFYTEKYICVGTVVGSILAYMYLPALIATITG